MATVDITANTFEETIEKPGIVLLDFWASWCGPCKAFAPVFDKASEQHADATFGKIDTDAEQQLASEFQISGIPTLMVFRDGIPLYREAGALPPAKLEALIQQVKALDMNEVRAEYAAAQAAHQHEHGPNCNHDHDGHDHGPEGHNH